MSEVFGQVYADAYDHIYRDKDYDGETDVLERVFLEYAPTPVHRVLDLGCGTGNHALRLAAKGYHVVGVDRSAEMLEVAQSKARQEGVSIRLHQGDVREVDLGESFDAAVMMFAVLGYQLENDDVLNALKTARNHLKPQGLLVFDVWYGPTVLAQRPGDRVRIIETENGTLLRAASGELDIRRHVCAVRFHLWQMEGDRVLARTDETHPMRFFFPQELELFLEVTGFHLLRLGAFPDFDRDPDETTWNVMVVGQAV